MSIPLRLRIPRRLYDTLLAHARDSLPNECCGFLAGSATGIVSHVFPLVNEAASPILYFAQDHSLFQAHRAMRAAELEHLAIYHSHPTSAPIPSRTDLANNFYGSEIVHLIISLQEEEPRMRGWQLEELGFREVGWECVEEVDG